MADGTKIEWTATRLADGTVIPGATFNIVWGCQKVGPGCEHCYALTWAKRHGYDVWGPAKTTPRRVLSDDYWAQPLKWAKRARKLGVRQKVFCSSMADVFEDHPTVAEQRVRLWPLIEQTGDALDWLLLTKRPEHVEAAMPDDWRGRWPRCAWLGFSAENQEWFDRRWPVVAELKVAHRIGVVFVSAEPLLGPLDVSAALTPQWYSVDRPPPPGIGFPETMQSARLRPRLDWVIAGGESGPRARPPHPDWFRSLRDQCQAAEVPYLFKQWGEELPKGQGEHGLDERGLFRRESFIGGQAYYRVGKKAAGRLLDGRTWDEVPA